MIAQIFTVTAPVFCIVALGYGWSKWQQPFHTETLTNLVVKLATPCLVFTTLTKFDLGLKTIGVMALAAVCALMLSALIGTVVLKFSGLSLNTYLASLMHPNTGNIGLPLAFMAFGEQGLALGIAYFIVISISQYTIGYGLSAGTLSPKRLLQQPLIYVVLISITVVAIDIQVPVWVAKTSELISGIVIPALLMVLGYSLAQLKITDLRLAVYLATVRLIMGLLVGTILIVVLELKGEPAGVVFLMCIMPIAVFNFVFAKHFNRSPDTIAGVIVASTLLVFTLLPALVWMAINISQSNSIPRLHF